jgi:tetraacyldisaccharide 4'-kinase
MKLSELYWHRITPLHFLLWPFSIAYEYFLTLKKLCYWLDIFPAVRLPVPVIVVDSLSLIDDNKPPLLVWVVDTLLRHGYTPGIITRGSSDHPGPPRAITVAGTDAARETDSKAFMLAQQCGKSCPVWIGGNRVVVAKALLNAHPACDIVICTDGLTDFRLERDIEIVIVDFDKQNHGNGLLIPAGPLRMKPRQLTKNSIVVTSGRTYGRHNNLAHWRKTYNMKLVNDTAYNVLNPATRQPVADFKAKKIHAVTDDDNARWFFDLLHQSGLTAQLHDYRDKHRFKAAEIEFPNADAVLMPEENAFQCQSFAHEKLWAVPRKAWINDELQNQLVNRLQKIGESA